MQRESNGVAIVGVSAILPEAPDVESFWRNLQQGRDCISEVRPDRWDPMLYWDADHRAPEKTYSKIGGWVRSYEWDPVKWKLPIPPRVAAAMDEGQRWAVSCARAALLDYGWPQRKLDTERTAVILGNALGGEKHILTSLRILYPEFIRGLEGSPAFRALPEAERRKIVDEARHVLGERLPPITEDTMPGELSNCLAGRIANLFDLRGPNFTTDAACASALAAIGAAFEGLIQNRFDSALCGGIDRNMGVDAFVKFCKIGALSATGSRPYASGADGFVMGEGAALFLLKRADDAFRDGDRIYAVIRGVGASSDGKGKGITAPNPVGQKLAMRRGWENAGFPPGSAGLVEGHGTSTKVGDAVEVQSLSEVFAPTARPGSIALGSVKSNIGHLKAAAGAAGILKVALSLHHKSLPPSIHFDAENPAIEFIQSPFRVNAELRPWEAPRDGTPRRAGVSAFGFGGTNFHVVLEEPVEPSQSSKSRSFVPDDIVFPVLGPIAQAQARPPVRDPIAPAQASLPLRGAILIGAADKQQLQARLEAVQRDALAGKAPSPRAPTSEELAAQERVAIDYGSAADLADRAGRALKALQRDDAASWKPVRGKGVFRGRGKPGKVAFLYTGQGSQYVGMLARLRTTESAVAEVFAEADREMKGHLDRPLSEYIFADPGDPAADVALRQTAITQPAVLAADLALTRLLEQHGVRPDMVMGHSLGEYAALVTAGALPFADALEAVSARGREMTRVAVKDTGKMAAIGAPLEVIAKVLSQIDGYVVIANINSPNQAVIGGASRAVELAVEALGKLGHGAVMLPVSHAFHTDIVAAATDPLRRVLERLRLSAPLLPIISNVTGEFYEPERGKMLDLLGKQVAAPVQFIKGLEALYAAGARVFIEVGPKKALQSFAEAVLGDREGVSTLFTNHPKLDEIACVNQALCGLWAAGVGAAEERKESPPQVAATAAQGEVERLFAEFVERGSRLLGKPPAIVHERAVTPEPVVITGAALGLPGRPRIFDDANLGLLLRGEQLIDSIPARLRKAMLDKRVIRLVKSEEKGASFESIESTSDVIKLAGRAGALDLVEEFGLNAERVDALDTATRLAIGAGIDALRDAGIPLVMRYKTTTRGTRLPDRFALPEEMRDDTGIIFASAFPGLNAFADETARYGKDRARREQLETLEALAARIKPANGYDALTADIAARISGLRAEIDREPYAFDRRFLFRVLSMGHSQFAELIGARGPNTQINSACASTTQAVSLAEDWIRAGRCKRAIVIAGDDATSDHLFGWIGAGFLASGAAATDENVEDAATPFDRRRHGMIVGMGAAALVVESAASARERGLAPICEVLATATANGAFHGTRLDIEHIGGVMEGLVAQAEKNAGVARGRIAKELVFYSHETYTPARGGSAAAEVHALRRVFKEDAAGVLVANTKGFTGHPMGVGIEDVMAVKSLETGLVPPIPNFREVDPELGELNLSRGGAQPVEFALRLGAGFGSQISMTLLRRVPAPDGQRRTPEELGYPYRLRDRGAFERFLARASGQSAAQLEVVKRTLRVKDAGVPATKAPEPRAAIQTPPPPPPPRPVAALKAVAAPKPPAAPTPPQGDPVRAKVLEIISAKTGYAPDMLDIDLDLEADLGVDTVKQAETFAAVREVYSIPRDENLKLRDFPTIKHLIQFVHDRKPAEKEPLNEKLPIEAVPTGKPTIENHPIEIPTGADPVREKVLEIISAKTGYAPDMLDIDLDLEADLGVDTVKQAETFAAVREVYSIPRDENLKLRDFPTIKHLIQFVHDRKPAVKEPLNEKLPIEAVPTGKLTIENHPIEIPTGADPVREKVLEIISAKTGYAPDMLDIDLDLEADLGVDTVKQAETFAAVRELYSIPRDENLKLRDFPTIKHLIQFVHDRQPAEKGPLIAKLPVETLPVETLPIETLPIAIPVDALSVREKVLEIISAKTGYAPDMLDIDLDLEADLGVDTVKQAETFAAVRELYSIPRDESLKLRDFPTIKHLIQFVHDRTREPQKAVVAEVRSAPSLAPADAVPRRVPMLVVRPPLEICKETGVSLAAGTRVLVMPDQGGVAAALQAALRARGVEVALLDPQASIDELRKQVASAPGAGLFWLPALDDEGELTSLSTEAWHEGLRVRVKLLAAAARELYPSLGEPGGFLVAATRLGGRHGAGGVRASAPMGGAVTGFTKAIARERPRALVKAVDFEADRAAGEVAQILIDEALRDPGAVEIGRRGVDRFTLGLREEAAAASGVQLGRDTVFVVTGAAGSIVSAIVADLAEASGGTFHLLDLAKEPDATDPELQKFATDREGLKRDLFERIKARDGKATPVQIDRELAGWERASAAQRAISAVRAAGGKAIWHSLDLRDGEAVQRALAGVARVDVLVHAAGLEISHLLPDKPDREFDLVFDVKADGFFHLLRSCKPAATVVFSSVAGRFGNGGQTDYSAANDLLCKVSASLPEHVCAVAIDWTAWAGIGMAARGSIPKMMELAGIGTLPPSAGVPTVRRELTLGGRGEVLVATSLGLLAEERDPAGGLDPARVAVAGRGPMIGRVVRWSVNDGIEVETRLDPAEQPFLRDHQIEGTPVLPGVMGIEAFAELATLLVPGMRVQAVEGVEFQAPFKFYRSQPRTVRLFAQLREERGELLADCRLVGERVLPGQEAPQLTTHFSARVRLARTAPGPLPDAKPHAPNGHGVIAADIYRVFFHGPAYQVLERAWSEGADTVGLLPAALPEDHAPASAPLAISPRLIELCFQTAGLREMRDTGHMGLPRHIDSVQALGDPFVAQGRLQAVVVEREGAFDAQVVDDGGHAFVRLAGYRTSALPGDLPAAARERIGTL